MTNVNSTSTNPLDYAVVAYATSFPETGTPPQDNPLYQPATTTTTFGRARSTTWSTYCSCPECERLRDEVHELRKVIEALTEAIKVIYRKK